MFNVIYFNSYISVMQLKNTNTPKTLLSRLIISEWNDFKFQHFHHYKKTDPNRTLLLLCEDKYKYLRFVQFKF